jgi:phosphonate transport system substrate-binding protein
MSYLFTVTPDFSPAPISGWYIFNTWLQRQLGIEIHLELYPNFGNQWIATYSHQIDLIYANPFDAAILIREKQFLPLVKPAGFVDEAVIAVSQDSAIQSLSDLKMTDKIALTDDLTVNTLGGALLETMGFAKNTLNRQFYESYILVAKNILRGQVQAGIFLAAAFDGLSNLTKKQLRVLSRSEVGEVHHTLLLGTQLASRHQEIQTLLIQMNQNEKDQAVLTALGLSAWLAIELDKINYLIDLIEKLTV